MKLSLIASTLALAATALAESHTVTLVNNCPSGNPVFLYQGNGPRGSGTIDGQVLGGVAWVDGFAGADCQSSGVNCGIVEFTLTNPDDPDNTQNAADYSLLTGDGLGNHQLRYTEYTVPFIVDSSTGAVVSDSYRIAEYLDKIYPDTPRLVPEGTEGLQWAFGDAILLRLYRFWGWVRPLMIEKAHNKEFLKGVEKAYGPPMPPMSDEEKKATWGVVKAALDDISKYYKEGQLFLTGDKPIYADFSFIPIFFVVKTLFGNDSEEWKEVASWNGGRWAKMLDAAQYMSTEVV
ncbi:hypothetical protein VNI00_018401 [Paramarasmius palmivorus]|uniref:Glutathione S-transferase UstS-like C-terminal domain-containing protein n=1 Tax=Paramarasmius palmivorus TaxID=297713 RepID=A0AAW0AWT9_9AGAR